MKIAPHYTCAPSIGGVELHETTPGFVILTLAVVTEVSQRITCLFFAVTNASLSRSSWLAEEKSTVNEYHGGIDLIENGLTGLLVLPTFFAGLVHSHVPDYIESWNHI